jgi:hypothetical protein
MLRKKAYRATDVKRVDVAAALAAHPCGDCEAGIDVRKEEVRVVLRWDAMRRGHGPRACARLGL